MRPEIIFPFFLFTLLACGDSDETKKPIQADIVVEEASDFNTYFTRSGGGWTGGDVGFTVPLPDGRILWVFGDSFLGTVNPDRSRAPQGFVNNTFMIQDGETFTTLAGNGPSAFLVPENAEEKYWPQDGFVNNNKLYVFLYAWKLNGQGGSFGFEFVRTDLAVFSLPGVTLDEIRTFSDNSVIWGAAIMHDGEYIYNYGSKDTPGLNEVHLSRRKIADTDGPWEFYSAFGWVADKTATKALINGNSNQYSVFKQGEHYYLFNQEDVAFSNKIYRYKASHPEGPFTDKKLVYETPYYGTDTWTYNAKAHPEFMEDGELLISWNVNCLDFNKLFANADLYRLYFARVKNWE